MTTAIFLAQAWSPVAVVVVVVFVLVLLRSFVRSGKGGHVTVFFNHRALGASR